MNENNSSTDSRRSFLKKSSAVAAATIAAPYIALSPNSFANSQTLKVGLVGCGGRGTGAAREALKADKNVVLTAVGDIFEKQIDSSLSNLEKEVGDKLKVDGKFVGLDAYEKVINSGVDVVVLATPPGFRPQHLKAAVAAGKHVFCEKPVATDAAGVRTALEAVAEAKKKNLGLGAGFCWRYNLAERALFERVHAGDIGDLRVFYGTYYTGPVKPMPPANTRPPGMGDLEWQLRNWYNFVWLSGDGLVEQAVHAVDWMCWAFKDVPPIKAVAVGGRQIPAHGGNIFDHFEINYEYADGARAFLGCRQIAGCSNDNTATMYGTKGTARELGFAGMPFIRGEKNWKYSGPRPNMYQVEHDELFASIRKGEPLNDGVRLCHSSMAAIMGRMAAYTGAEVTWEEALNSNENLVPENLDWKMNLPVVPLAMPGQNRMA
ncbi:MAG TPA: Gfo/Idh/MocA family oxidoreductase [Candidatus Kapabacteria bacterium]|jgi:myo-inositol 2-dehydrogenase / D-chiro-inositol 1-dehydrogenase|nr:Gfo/Idh/MocA family oxidoreductase [Candidatus Kapabacteria bacterium]